MYRLPIYFVGQLTDNAVSAVVGDWVRYEGNWVVVAR